MNSFVESVCVKKLLPWAAFPPTKMSAKELGELAEDIEKNGIQDPVKLVVNPITNEIRLDCGNHRVYFLPIIGITHLPTVAYVTNEDVVLNAGNGTHSYKTDCIIASIGEQSYYCKPSLAVNFGI